MAAKTVQTCYVMKGIMILFSKLQFFSKPGLIIWSSITIISQIIPYYNLSTIMLPLLNFPMQVMIVLTFVCRMSFYILCPLAIYLVGYKAKFLLLTVNVQVPRYWPVIFLAKAFDALNIGVSYYMHWSTNNKNIVFDVYSTILDLILALVFGTAMATQCVLCSNLVSKQNNSLVSRGKEILRSFQQLKKGSQLGLFSVFVFRTSFLVLNVSINKMQGYYILTRLNFFTYYKKKL